MLRTTSGLSRSVGKWASQVTVSLGATLSATLIWSAVPHPGAAPAPRPELTSGGKFAARAIQPVADDGLGAMPLPHVAPPPARFSALPVEAAPPAVLRRASWDEAAPPVPQERSSRVVRPTRPPNRAEARRVEPVPRVAPVAAAEAPAPGDDEARQGFLRRVIPSAFPDILPSIASTAREAWTVTASAGDALVSRMVPRIP